MNQRTIAVVVASAGAVLALVALLADVIRDGNGFGPVQVTGLIVGVVALAWGTFRYRQLAKLDAAGDEMTWPTPTSDD